MTTVNVTLLLGFSMVKPSSEISKSSKKVELNKETVVGKKGADKKAKIIQKVEVVVETDSVEKPANLFEVGSPQKFAHIEYELLPERVPFKVDVNCWGNFAKIYCEDDSRAIRTIQINQIAWVPVKIKHFFKSMSKSELLKLQFHVIKFTIWSQQDQLEQHAKLEKATSFYTFQEHLGGKEIVEVFEKAPSDEKRYEDYLREERLNKELLLFNKCAFRGDAKSSYLAYLNYFPDELHDYTIKKMIEKISAGVSIKCKEFVRVWCAKVDKSLSLVDVVVEDSSADTVKSKKSETRTKKLPKKKKPEKQTTLEPLTITVSGEVFFTDPNLSVHRIAKNNREVHDGYALLTVKNLMTRAQKNEMNPLVINIKKIVKLPVNIITKHGFQRIRTMYNVPRIAQCITTEKPIADTLHINEAHVFFLESTPESMLYDFFYTKEFTVQLIGIRKKTKGKSVKPASLFGTDNKDVAFSKRLQPFECLKNKPLEETFAAVLLAVASYDISALLKCSWCFTVESPCVNPDSAMSMKTNDPLLFTDIINAQELNLDSFKPEPTGVSCLTDDVLMDFGTAIVVEMFLQAPQSALLKWHTVPYVFQRLLIVTGDDLLATNLLNQILLHNQKFLATEVVTSDYLKTGMKVLLNKESTDIHFLATSSDDYNEMVTGFLLDNVTSYIFYIEGMPTGVITTLWNQVRELPLNVAITHFNTKQVFSKRLYEEFISFGGFYVITLQTALKEIMAQTHIYLKGNAPLPCWEALKRFDLLLRCKIIKDMSQLNLFPSAKQLLSLDIEFGVPLRWVKPRKKSIVTDDEEKNT